MRLTRKFLVIIALLFSIQATAKKLEGFIILNNNQKINVTLLIPFGFLSRDPNYEALQLKVKYLDESNKSATIRPNDAKEVSFQLNGKQVRLISVQDNLDLISLFSSQTNIFLKLEIEGKLKLFSYYYKQQSSGMYNATTGTTTGAYTYNAEKYILQKGNGPLFRPKGLSFKKDMVKFLFDCEIVGQKIEGKEFRKGDMELIVQEYNKQCSQ